MKTIINYDIRLNYVAGSKNPSRVFSSMAQMIESLKKTDDILGKSINCVVETDQILDDIQAGSIIARIQEWIEVKEDIFCIPENQNKIQNYFNRSKKAVIKTLESKVIDDRFKVEALADEIEGIAKDEKLTELMGYSKPNPLDIAENLKDIAKSTDQLIDNESIEYTASDGECIKLQPQTEVFIDSIKTSLISKTLTSENIIILKIKKPDYLGDSRWDFKHDKTALQAKIEDSQWMDKFHKKQITIGPGDALEVKMKTIVDYDNKGNVINLQNIIIVVNDIIQTGVDDNG